MQDVKNMLIQSKFSYLTVITANKNSRSLCLKTIQIHNKMNMKFEEKRGPKFAENHKNLKSTETQHILRTTHIFNPAMKVYHSIVYWCFHEFNQENYNHSGLSLPALQRVIYYK